MFGEVPLRRAAATRESSNERAIFLAFARAPRGKYIAVCVVHACVGAVYVSVGLGPPSPPPPPLVAAYLSTKSEDGKGEQTQASSTRYLYTCAHRDRRTDRHIHIVYQYIRTCVSCPSHALKHTVAIISSLSLPLSLSLSLSLSPSLSLSLSRVLEKLINPQPTTASEGQSPSLVYTLITPHVYLPT